MPRRLSTRSRLLPLRTSCRSDRVSTVLKVVLGCTLALAACQSVDGDGMGGAGNLSKHFRERRGWAVGFVTAREQTPAHCLGYQSATRTGLRITFMGGETESGFRLDGIPPDRALAVGEDLLANYDGGERRTFNILRAGAGSATVMFPTRRYEDAMYAFAHSRFVEFRGRTAGPIGTIDLRGSSWTINATDECRRIKVPPLG